MNRIDRTYIKLNDSTPFECEALVLKRKGDRCLLKCRDSWHSGPYYNTGTINTDARGSETITPDDISCPTLYWRSYNQVKEQFLNN